MKSLILLAICGLSMLTATISCTAKDWNGIVPLKTTRADVLKILETPMHDRATKKEYFEVRGEKITIRWQRPDCYGLDSIVDVEPAKPDFLVYQITVEPKIPNKISVDVNESKDVDKASAKSVFDKWISNDVDCIGSSETGFACSVFNRNIGFGYSNSKDGVTSIYYFPSDRDEKAWTGQHSPCSDIQNKISRAVQSDIITNRNFSEEFRSLSVISPVLPAA